MITFREEHAVDLLFMIDNSCPMAAEQGLLRHEIPRMIRALTSGDLGLDGRPDVRPLDSLHVGIIDSDLGGGDAPPGDPIPSCEAGLGDDGILRDTSRGGAGCIARYPNRFFAWDAAMDPMAFSAAVGCVADVGTGGCKFEQPLEAILKALSPAAPQSFVSPLYEPPTFALGGVGHGDGINAGFLREGSVLAIVLLSGQDDGSVPDYDLFSPSDRDYRDTPLNLRTSRFPDALYPTQRYVHGLLQLRDDPRSFVFAPIVGVPADLPMRGYGPCDPRLRDDARVQLVEDTMMDPPQRLLPSCSTADGIAYPPRRIIDVACGLEERGARVSLQSICASSFGPAIDVVINHIGTALRDDCIESLPLGDLSCDAVLTLPTGHGCDELGLAPADVGCAVPGSSDTDAGVSPGWAREADSLCGAGRERLVLRGLSPPPGSRIDLRCVPEGETCP